MGGWGDGWRDGGINGSVGGSKKGGITTITASEDETQTQHTPSCLASD